ncbi:ankyrin, partial [Gymnopus androsaceus JB14]
TALSQAAQNGFIDVVKLLIVNNAEIEIPDDAGYTPLLIAAEKSHMNIVSLLLENGANVNAQTVKGRT